jgi:hypothetical protein
MLKVSPFFPLSSKRVADGCKRCGRRLSQSVTSDTSLLRDYLDSVAGIGQVSMPFQNDSDREVFTASLERIYRRGMKRRHFKVICA